MQEYSDNADNSVIISTNGIIKGQHESCSDADRLGWMDRAERRDSGRCERQPGGYRFGNVYDR